MTILPIAPAAPLITSVSTAQHVCLYFPPFLSILSLLSCFLFNPLFPLQFVTPMCVRMVLAMEQGHACVITLTSEALIVILVLRNSMVPLAILVCHFPLEYFILSRSPFLRTSLPLIFIYFIFQIAMPRIVSKEHAIQVDCVTASMDGRATHATYATTTSSTALLVFSLPLPSRSLCFSLLSLFLSFVFSLLLQIDCDPGRTCSGHGTCNSDGSCTCNSNYTGDASCSSCSVNQFGPNCDKCMRGKG